MTRPAAVGVPLVLLELPAKNMLCCFCLAFCAAFCPACCAGRQSVLSRGPTWLSSAAQTFVTVLFLAAPCFVIDVCDWWPRCFVTAFVTGAPNRVLLTSVTGGPVLLLLAFVAGWQADSNRFLRRRMGAQQDSSGPPRRSNETMKQQPRATG